LADKRYSIYAIMDLRVLNVIQKLTNARTSSLLGARFVPRYGKDRQRVVIEVKPASDVRLIRWAVSGLPEAGIEIGDRNWVKRRISRNEAERNYWG
jgi:hypothetical protein